MQKLFSKKYIKNFLCELIQKFFFEKNLYLYKTFLCLKIFYCKIYNGRYFKSKLIKFYGRKS